MRLTKLLGAIALIFATTVAPAFAIQCVPYAREVSGIKIKGDAWQWWNAAAGVYERGRTPQDGAVLVFARQGSMRYGHVSVVTRVLSNRLVLVDHANWAPARGAGRGEITQAVPVLDVSPNNDWSQVRVWFRPTADYGNRAYKADGFVYNTGMGAPSASRPHVERVALTRAAAIVPSDKALSRYAEPVSVPVKVETARTETATAVPAIVADSAKSMPSTDDLVSRAAKPAIPADAAKSAHNRVNDFIFN